MIFKIQTYQLCVLIATSADLIFGNSVNVRSYILIILFDLNLFLIPKLS